MKTQLLLISLLSSDQIWSDSFYYHCFTFLLPPICTETEKINCEAFSGGMISKATPHKAVLKVLPNLNYSK